MKRSKIFERNFDQSEKLGSCLLNQLIFVDILTRWLSFICIYSLTSSKYGIGKLFMILKTLVDSSFRFDTINLEWSIIFSALVRGHRLYFPNIIVIVFFLAICRR